MTLLALLAGCNAGSRVSQSAASSLGNFEYQRLKGQGVPVDNLTFAVVVDGDFALVGANSGDHWMTSLYHRAYDQWHWIASKGNSPAPCLFFNVHISAEQAERLTTSLLRVAKHPKAMQLDDWYVPCHGRS